MSKVVEWGGRECHSRGSRQRWKEVSVMHQKNPSSRSCDVLESEQ